MLERDNRLFFWAADVAPILHGHLESDFDRGRPVVRKENMRERLGQKFSEQQAQLFDGFVGEASEQDMVELRGLPRDRDRNCRVTMAVNVDPPGGDPIDQTPAIARMEAYPRGACDPYGRRVERFLGKRMPDAQSFAHACGKFRTKC